MRKQKESVFLNVFAYYILFRCYNVIFIIFYNIIYIKIDLSFFKIRYLQRIKQQKNDLFLLSFEAFTFHFRKYNERNKKQKVIQKMKRLLKDIIKNEADKE